MRFKIGSNQLTTLFSLLFVALFSSNGFCVDLSVNGPGELIVSCNLDGSPGQCLLDTGARISTVNTDMVSETWLSSHPASGAQSLAGFGGIIEQYPTTIVKDTQLGDLAAQNVSYVLNRVEDMSNVGGNVLAAMTNATSGLYFDFNQMKLESVPQDKFNSLQALIVVNHTPLLPANVGDKSVTLVWDTGNANQTMISQSFINANPTLFTRLDGDSNAADFSGQDFGGGLYLCKELSIGGLVFTNVKVVATDLTFMNQRMGTSFQGVLSKDVIVQANWYLNYQTLKWTAQQTAIK